MPDNKLVSIIVNCFNGEKYLKGTLDSIISQTYCDWELIFWDNRSTDLSARIFQSYSDKRFKYFLSETHTSLNHARTNALEKISGDFFCFLDTDDTWFPNRLESQIKAFDQKVSFIYSNVIYFNKEKEKVCYKKKQPEGYIYDKLLMNYNIASSSVLFSTEVVKNLKVKIDTQFDTIADYDLIMRLASNHKVKYVDLVLAKVRMHRDSLTWKFPYQALKEIELWYEKQLDFYYKDKKFSRILKISKKKNFSKHARMLIMYGRKSEAFSMILKSAMWDWKWLVTLFLFFMPFSKKILQSNHEKNFD